MPDALLRLYRRRASAAAGTSGVDRNSVGSAWSIAPRYQSEEHMSRIKLGLFGAARPSTVSAGVNTLSNARSAEAQDRLTGLTPIEIAAAEAMSRNEAVLTAR